MKSQLALFLMALSLHLTLSQKTQLELRQQFSAKDFVYDLDNASVVLRNGGGSLRPLTVSQMPALAGQRIAYALLQLDPCGLVIPEVHPRATEMTYLIEGNNLQVGFAEENGGRFLINVLKKGQVSFFPQGLIHFEQNLSCQPVKYISALNHEDPGVLSMSTRTFGLPSYALQSTFNRTQAEIDLIRAGLPAGPAAGYGECVTRCMNKK